MEYNYNYTWPPTYSAPAPPPPPPHYYYTNPNPNPAYSAPPPAANNYQFHHPPPPTVANSYATHGGYSFPHHLPVGPTPPPGGGESACPYCHSSADSAGGLGRTGWISTESTQTKTMGYGSQVPPRPPVGLGSLVPYPGLSEQPSTAK